jgi:uncharacterized cupredoxin-like copper-binding protein
MHRVGFLVVGLLLLGVATACAGGAASGASQPTSATPTSAVVDQAGVQQITIDVGNSMSFKPTELAIQAGKPVEVTLRNSGSITHDFTLTDGVAQPVTVVANGGETASASFTVDTPGTYTFVCSVPGHASAGMRGTLSVQ